jgi:hypothetical protein
MPLDITLFFLFFSWFTFFTIALLFMLFLGLRFDTMDVVPKKLFYQSKLSLEVDCYNSISIFDIVITSTITIMNFTTTNVAQQWALLAK